jgi:hypothetical protein
MRWSFLETGGEPGVSPSGPPSTTCYPAGPSLPWVPCVTVPPLPRYSAPRRLPPAPLGSLRLTRASRYRACFTAFVVALSGSWPGRSPQGTPGPVVARSPHPGWRHGDRGFSHVPAGPRCRPAPLAHPGGVLCTRRSRPPEWCLPAQAHRRLWPRCCGGSPVDHDSTSCGAP